MGYNRELDIKLERIRKMLNKENLDACYIKRQDNFAWLTCGGVNYIGIGETGNCGLLVTADQTFAVTNNIEALRMTEEEKLEELGFKVIQDIWYKEDHEVNAIKKICGEGRIGCDYQSLLGKDLSSKIQPLRFSLTKEEIERYKTGGRLFSWAIEEVLAATEPGDTEIEIAGRLNQRLRKSGLQEVTIMCASDERIYKYKHPIPTNKKVCERVQLGANVRYKGLTICCTRYINFVKIEDDLKEQYGNNVVIDCTLIQNTIPGKSYQVPFLAGKKMYEKLGFEEEFIKHHLGGPIGYVPRDYRISFSHHGMIPENQAFCWNPSLSGTKSEDTFIATKEGPIFITKPYLFPKISVDINGKVFQRPNILEKIL